MPLVLNGTTGVQDNSGAFVAGTAVASTSGTSIDFTSIPSWVKRITVMFSGVSTNGSSNPLVQIGAGSITTSGYLGSSALLLGSVTSTQFTTGFGFSNGNAAHIRHGNLVITLLSGNTWVASGIMQLSNTNEGSTSAGSITIGGTLDRVRITTVNGTDTFDAGSINILYE
jgi:hypothetical protein